MKWRIGASLFQQFTGRQRSYISRVISANPSRFAGLNGDGFSDSLYLGGSYLQKRSSHFSASDEDDFSELGPVNMQDAGLAIKRLKLATEKPVSFMKTDSGRKAFTERLSPTEEILNLIDHLKEESRTSSTVRCKLKKQHDDSRCTFNSKNEFDMTDLRSVTIESIPSTVDLPQLMEAISVFGEVTGASMRTIPNGLNCCHVEFKTVESRMKAISAGGIKLRSFHLPVCSLRVPQAATVRIKNISNKTADPAVHSLCKSFGSLEGLVRTKKDTVDVFYRVDDNFDLQSILKRLNDIIIDDCRWSAHLLQGDSTAPVMTKNQDTKRQLGLEIKHYIAELNRQISMDKIDAEDLENLHSAVLRLENTLHSSSGSSP